MIKRKTTSQQLQSKQPYLNAVYGLSRFSGFYFLAGLNARIASNQRPYWEILIQDAFDTVVIYSDTIETTIKHLSPFSPIQIECAKRYHNGAHYFVADMINPVCNIPTPSRHISLIPYSVVINGYDLPRLIDCVCNITFAPLQQFIHEVLLQTKVMVPFVRNPASLRYHHNIPGGLLSHSLAVVDLITNEFANGTVEHDIAITAALLHDIGKTQTLSDNLNRTAIGSLADHDALTLEICAESLAQLSLDHPHIANQLRHAWTCASPNARYGFRPKTRVARELQIADNRNANGH